MLPHRSSNQFLTSSQVLDSLLLLLLPDFEPDELPPSLYVERVFDELLLEDPSELEGELPRWIEVTGDRAFAAAAAAAADAPAETIAPL